MAGHEVKAPRVTATGTLYAGPCRLKGLWWSGGSADGTLILKDGGASGTTLLTVDIATSYEGSLALPDPDGIRFETDCHITIGTNVATAVTGFVEG